MKKLASNSDPNLSLIIYKIQYTTDVKLQFACLIPKDYCTYKGPANAKHKHGLDYIQLFHLPFSGWVNFGITHIYKYLDNFITLDDDILYLDAKDVPITLNFSPQV